MCAYLPSDRSSPSEGYITVGHARLYYREIGRGRPMVVLHGGPDFDHSYLLPELDALSGSLRLIYYDQRGRGRSAAGIQPDDVTLESDVEDLERLREYFGLQSMAVMGHSWGGLLAMEYAIRHPERVAHLILAHSAPASRGDYLFFRQELTGRRAPDDLERLTARPNDPGYQAGDPDTVAAYYRNHFRAALREPAHLEIVVERLRASFTPEGVLKSRAIEDRLMDQTWLREDYDLLPGLTRLPMPTLVLHAQSDFIPPEVAAHIAGAIPGARLVVFSNCGHFSYLECPDEFRRAVTEFLNAG